MRAQMSCRFISRQGWRAGGLADAAGRKGREMERRWPSSFWKQVVGRNAGAISVCGKRALVPVIGAPEVLGQVRDLPPFMTNAAFGPGALMTCFTSGVEREGQGRDFGRQAGERQNRAMASITAEAWGLFARNNSCPAWPRVGLKRHKEGCSLIKRLHPVAFRESARHPRRTGAAGARTASRGLHGRGRQ